LTRLDPRAAAAGVRLVTHEVLASTNAEGLRLAGEGEGGPLWVVAARQTGGRGRRGRTWISPPGNLYASLLLTDPAPVAHWPQLSFVAALAIHDAVVEVAAHLAPALAVKWPNDLLLAGAKLAGILIEGSRAGALGVLVIGIGVNCASHPQDTEYPAAHLAGVTPQRLLAALSVTMQARLAQWSGGEGFPAIRADWLARAVGRGEDVRVRLVDREIAGRFEALDEAGALVLRRRDGSVVSVAAGDVFPLAAALAGAG
jgi:BirA family transcriptional regulator, biotin operon repressor / biotin---[acetyl-CoA-carboxylase] ligase